MKLSIVNVRDKGRPHKPCHCNKSENYLESYNKREDLKNMIKIEIRPTIPFIIYCFKDIKIY